MHLNLLQLRLLSCGLRAAVSRCRRTIILLRFYYLHTLAGQGPSVAKLPLRFSRSCGCARVCSASKMCTGDIDVNVAHGAQKLFIAHLQVLLASVAKTLGRGDLVCVVQRCCRILLLSLPS